MSIISRTKPLELKGAIALHLKMAKKRITEVQIWQPTGKTAESNTEEYLSQFNK